MTQLTKVSRPQSIKNLIAEKSTWDPFKNSITYPSISSIFPALTSKNLPLNPKKSNYAPMTIKSIEKLWEFSNIVSDFLFKILLGNECKKRRNNSSLASLCNLGIFLPKSKTQILIKFSLHSSCKLDYRPIQQNIKKNAKKCHSLWITKNQLLSVFWMIVRRMRSFHSATLCPLSWAPSHHRSVASWGCLVGLYLLLATLKIYEENGNWLAYLMWGWLWGFSFLFRGNWFFWDFILIYFFFWWFKFVQLILDNSVLNRK